MPAPREPRHEGLEFEDEISAVASGGGLAALWTGLGYGVTVVASLLVARIVGADVLGSVSVALSVAVFLQTLTTVGLDRGVLKYVSEAMAQRNAVGAGAVVRYATKASLAASAVVIAAYTIFLRPRLNQLFPAVAAVEPITTVFVFILPISSFTLIYGNALTALQRPQVQQMATGVLRPLLQLAGLLVLMTVWSKLTSLTIATALAYAAGAAFVGYALWFHWQSIAPVAASTGAPATTWRAFLAFSLPLALIPVMNQAGQQLDVVLVGIFVDDAGAGVYTVVKRVAALALLPLLGFGGVTAATISRFFAHDDVKAARNLYRAATKWITFISVGIFVVIFWAPATLLSVAGPEYTTGAHALRILAIGQLVNASVGPSGSTLLVTGRQKWVVFNSAIAAFVGVGAGLLLVPRLELIGAALAVGGAVALVNLISAVQLWLFHRITPAPAKVLVGRLGIVLALAYIGTALPSFSPVYGALVAIAGGVGGFAVLYSLEGVDAIEVALFQRFTAKFRRSKV